MDPINYHRVGVENNGSRKKLGWTNGGFDIIQIKYETQKKNNLILPDKEMIHKNQWLLQMCKVKSHTMQVLLLKSMCPHTHPAQAVK